MSSINPNNIDGTYPIAGQDNDSQGFRDNFTNIKNNFTFAYNELVDLESKVVLKSALDGTTISNDMSYAQLISPQLLKSVETVNNLGSKTGSFTISWADAHFQYYTTTGDTTLAFSGWPDSALWTKLQLQITTDTANRTVTFPSAVSVNLSNISGASGQVVTLPTAGVYVFELTSYDNGTTIAIQDLLRNYDTTIQGYQLSKPTGNIGIAMNQDTNRLHIAPTGTAPASFYTSVTLPNVSIDGTVVTISSNVAVQFNRTVSGWGIYSVDSGANTAISAGSSISFLLSTSENKWFKVG
jgi:hypothetical protein